MHILRRQQEASQFSSFVEEKYKKDNNLITEQNYIPPN